MRLSAIVLTLLPIAVSAHFSLTYPEDRGDSDQTQDQSPCGGLNTPSSQRTRWPITGGQVSFEAGHDEANTAVYLALGNNPTAEDFTIVLKDKFLQVGLGTFCWNELPLPENVTVSEGQNATIQVVQEGHTGGGLYNCADITFSDAMVRIQTCSNGTGVTAESATSHGDHSSTESSSAAAASSTGGSDSAGNTIKVAAGSLVAGAVGVAALLL